MKRIIKGYGFEYSFSKFMRITILLMGGIVGAGIIYKLRWPCVVIVLVGAMASLPFIMLSQIRYLREQQKFADCAAYMEQMIYMFKKRPQVLFALRETKTILSDEAKQKCEQAIEYLEAGNCEHNLYEESLHYIESEYGCERMRILHRFFVRVEAEGGLYQEPLNLLLDDLKEWIQRVYQFQKERNKIKNNVTISIIATLVICFLTTKIFPSDYQIYDYILYQVTTTLMLLLMIGVYLMIQAKLSGTWLSDTQPDPMRFVKDYDRATCVGNGRKPPIVLLALMLIAIIYGIIIRKWLIVSMGVIGGIVLWRQPSRSKKAATKRCERELKKAFPVWLRELALILQHKPVSAAIVDSIPTAPVALQIPLKKMEEAFREDLVSIKPYQDFATEFELPEISSAMKLLYAMNSAGRDDMIGQIHSLLERNSKLQEKSEELQERDRIAVSGFLVVLPMIFSFVKLVADMMLLVSGFLEKFSGFL